MIEMQPAPGYGTINQDIEPENDDDQAAVRRDKQRTEDCSVSTYKDVDLLYGKCERLSLKDFSKEVRAQRDVEDFLSNTLLMLNLEECATENIILRMLQRVLEKNPDAGFSLEKAMKSIFTSDSVHILTKTIQGTTMMEDSGMDFDQSWICVLCDVPLLVRRQTVIARLHHRANLGSTSQEVKFVILVIGPTKEKTTKTTLETGRTFSTIFADINFRHRLSEVNTDEEFRRILKKHAEQLQGDQEADKLLLSAFEQGEGEGSRKWFIGRGLVTDLRRRLPHYISDYTDGIFGHRTPHKVISTTFFLYFACILPNIAFGMLNDTNTDGKIGVKKVLLSQCFGGFVFAVFGGQPLIVLLTTAPLSLYTKVIYNICKDFNLNFSAMFACVGLWNSFFLFLYAIFDVSKLMKWTTKSIEEIFSLFIVFAFLADAIKDAVKDFQENYYNPACYKSARPPVIMSPVNSSSSAVTMDYSLLDILTTMANISPAATSEPKAESPCQRENSILFLLLMLGTLWLSLMFFNFTKTPFLNANRREMLADYALPLSVLLMSFLGSRVFDAIKLKPFKYQSKEVLFPIVPLQTLTGGAVVASAGLGFSLSLLFFMDQNISSALVNTPLNKLKKGQSYHWDLFLIALINCFLSIFTFPWMHAALPHSPLHVRALADVEERIEQGHVHQMVVYVRETRITGIVSHLMIGLSLFLFPYPMSYIPRAVLDGLFLYVALTALFGNQLFDRILLLVTEQSAYPPNHYISRVPQRKIHTFTLIQLTQLLILCAFGFSPISYMKMVFPVLLMFLIPIRHKLVPKIIEIKYLNVLDGR